MDDIHYLLGSPGVYSIRFRPKHTPLQEFVVSGALQHRYAVLTLIFAYAPGYIHTLADERP